MRHCIDCSRLEWDASATYGQGRFVLLERFQDNRPGFPRVTKSKLYECRKCGAEWLVSMTSRWPGDPTPDETWKMRRSQGESR